MPPAITLFSLPTTTKASHVKVPVFGKEEVWRLLS